MTGFARWRRARLPSVSMLLTLLALLAIGVVFVHSATTGASGPFPGPAARIHLLRIGIGLGLLLIFLRIDYRRLETFAVPFYVFGIGSLLVLLGKKAVQGGVVRWFHLPGFNVQPSEVVKLLTIIMLARLLKPAGRDPTEGDHVRAVGVVALPAVLVALQPDLGTALVLPPVLLAMLWVAGVSGRRLAAYVGIALLAMPLGWFVMHDYQQDRVRAFLGFSEAAAASDADLYHAKQSVIAISSGGLTGKGLYRGTLNVLDRLPEDHNDFIFGVIGEEWGLRGTLSVLVLFLVLLLGCARIAYRTREPFGRFLAIGITAQLAFQTMVNLAMTVKLAPVTGLPLPFISYGGSSLLASIASVGIVLGIGMRPVRILTPDGLQAGTSRVLYGAFQPRRGFAR